MKRLRRSGLVVFAVVEVVVLLTLLVRPAYGYVDPGSGLLAIQVGGSMLAGGLFMLRAKVRKLLRLSPRVENLSHESPAPEAE